MTQQLREPSRKEMSADEFLSRSAPKTETMSVPEVGGDIVIRAITLEEREKITSGAKVLSSGVIDDSAFLALTLIHGMVTPRLEPKHIAGLKVSCWGVVDKIARRIWEISGVKYDKDGKAKAEEAAKNV